MRSDVVECEGEAREGAGRDWGERGELVRAALEQARNGWGERGEVVLETGGSYGLGRPVTVLVRKRDRRYDIGDQGAAVDAAGKPAGWLAVAERVVEEAALNVNRAGVVFVPVVEGRDIAGLALLVGETSRAVHAALLELGEG